MLLVLLAADTLHRHNVWVRFRGNDAGANRVTCRDGFRCLSIYAAIATLRKRLARAQAEREGWHAAGNETKYLEASSLVEALGLQLENLELALRGPA